MSCVLNCESVAYLWLDDFCFARMWYSPLTGRLVFDFNQSISKSFFPILLDQKVLCVLNFESDLYLQVDWLCFTLIWWPDVKYEYQAWVWDTLDGFSAIPCEEKKCWILPSGWDVNKINVPFSQCYHIYKVLFVWYQSMWTEGEEVENLEF